MRIENLFPKPVFFFKFRDFKKTEINFLTKLERTNNEGNEVSVERYLFENSQLKEIHTFIEEKVNEVYQKFYEPKFESSLYVTQAWTNYSKPGQWHHKHSHPNSILSGVLYIDADKTDDKIVFHNDSIPKRIEIYPKENGWNYWNSTSWWLPTEKLDLIIFQSDFIHSVNPVVENENRKERVSLSFNTFVKGYIGDDGSLTGLKL